MTNAVRYKNVLVDRTRLLWVRLVLPVATAFVGVALIVLGDEIAQGAGVFLIGVAGLVVLANAFVRLSLQSERDREREEARRAYFDEHGRWPDG
jgi:ABC-type transport system involved in cytochrome bd biosynthesis fused ATPase/permease subunit